MFKLSVEKTGCLNFFFNNGKSIERIMLQVFEFSRLYFTMRNKLNYFGWDKKELMLCIGCYDIKGKLNWQ